MNMFGESSWKTDASREHWMATKRNACIGQKAAYTNNFFFEEDDTRVVFIQEPVNIAAL